MSLFKRKKAQPSEEQPVVLPETAHDEFDDWQNTGFQPQTAAPANYTYNSADPAAPQWDTQTQPAAGQSTLDAIARAHAARGSFPTAEPTGENIIVQTAQLQNAPAAGGTAHNAPSPGSVTALLRGVTAAAAADSPRTPVKKPDDLDALLAGTRSPDIDAILRRADERKAQQAQAQQQNAPADWRGVMRDVTGEEIFPEQALQSYVRRPTEAEYRARIEAERAAQRVRSPEESLFYANGQIDSGRSSAPPDYAADDENEPDYTPLPPEEAPGIPEGADMTQQFMRIPSRSHTNPYEETPASEAEWADTGKFRPVQPVPQKREVEYRQRTAWVSEDEVQVARPVRNVLVSILCVLLTLTLLTVMILNAPIIRFRRTQGDTVTTQQVSILKYYKLWQPMVQQEGTLSKVAPEKLDLRTDIQEEEKQDGLDLQQTIEGQYTILFMGMDESGQLSDVNWIFQFDLIKGTMNILQIPRDTYMPDYASRSTRKFNSIYRLGQEEGVTPVQRVVNAIEENFCIPIDCYVKLNCEDIPAIVDSVGGVPINLPEQVYYEADKVLPAGEQVLNGKQSEWFVRFRREYSEGDLGRVKAQRIFLAAAMQKLLNMKQSEIMSAMQKIYKNQWIATDLSLEQISMIADFASKRLTLDAVHIFMVPGEAAYSGDQSVYSIHKATLIDLLNGYFRPYQNEIYPEASAVVELVDEEDYRDSGYDDTDETLEDIHAGRSSDGKQREDKIAG